MEFGQGVFGGPSTGQASAAQSGATIRTNHSLAKAVLFAVSIFVFASFQIASAHAAELRRERQESLSLEGIQPQHLAVDPTTGDLLVVELAANAPFNGSIHRFGANGAPVPFSVLGTSVIDGMGGEDATPQGAILGNEGSQGFQGQEVGVAVAPAGSPGGSEGDIYATDATSGFIDVFASSGKYLSQLGVGYPCGLDVGSDGTVYVGDYGGEVHELIPGPTGELTETSSFPSANTCQVAAGKASTEGAVFANEFEQKVTKFASLSGDEAYEVGVPPNRALAIDPSNGDVLVAHDENEVVEYEASGGAATPVWSQNGTGAIEGLAVAADGTLYVARRGAEGVEVFSAGYAPPTFVEAVSTGPGSATLRGTINPQGSSIFSCAFEYGLSPSLGSSIPCSSSIGAGTQPVPVSAEIGGLQADTRYYVRLVATDEAGGRRLGNVTTFVTGSAPLAGPCPNEAFRTGASALLPDCRAYEMVSPIDKGGGEIVANRGLHTEFARLDQAALFGDRMTYTSYQAFGGARSGAYASQYLSSRGTEGWQTEAISPPRGRPIPVVGPPQLESEFKSFSPDLGTAWVWQNSDRLTADALPELTNLYRRESGTGGYTSLTTNSPLNLYSDEEFFPELQGSSADGTRSIFRVAGRLTSDAPDLGPGLQAQLYEWSASEGIKLVSILPGAEEKPAASQSSAGTPYPASYPSGIDTSVQNAISADGSRVFWSLPVPGNSDPGPIYVRIDGKRTEAVSESVSSEPAEFWAADRTGDSALFTIGGSDCLRQIEKTGCDLYRFDVASGQASQIAGEVQGVVGAGQDLSYFYFVSREALGGGATADEPNLYVDHNGSIAFIATLGEDESWARPAVEPLGAQVKAFTTIDSLRPNDRSSALPPSGASVVFTSTESLTGFDNRDAASGKADSEVFRYDAIDNTLACISCASNGRQPDGVLLGVSSVLPPTESWAAARIPAWQNDLTSARVISDDGSRVFFDSYTALSPQDVNGKEDVYEWEGAGHGGCSRAPGCVHLISTGSSSQDSEFLDADATGDDVFIATSSSLVAQDPGQTDVYDARVYGGFPAPATPGECEGEGCQSATSPSASQVPGSSNFVGPENPKAKSAKHHKKKRRHRHRKHRHRKRHGRHGAAKGRAKAGKRSPGDSSGAADGRSDRRNGDAK